MAHEGAGVLCFKCLTCNKPADHQETRQTHLISKEYEWLITFRSRFMIYGVERNVCPVVELLMNLHRNLVLKFRHQQASSKKSTCLKTPWFDWAPTAYQTTNKRSNRTGTNDPAPRQREDCVSWLFQTCAAVSLLGITMDWDSSAGKEYDRWQSRSHRKQDQMSSVGVNWPGLHS